jgi:CubicO group peptidase (beta-lactamase class C family)
MSISLAAGPGKTRAADARAGAALERLLAHKRSPGVQYMFVSADAVLAEHNLGVADLVAQAPVTERTTFNAYSVTKTFTAAAILLLAEQRRLELDAPLAQYLGPGAFAGSPTIRQTLTHSAGFANPNPMSWVHLAEAHAAFDKPAFVRGVLHANHRLKSRPGDVVAYSNLGYLLLGEVIERVSGQPYVEFVQRQLIQPLGLQDGETLAFTIARPQAHARGTLKRWGLLDLAFGLFLSRDRFIAARCGAWLQLRDLYVNGAAYGGLIGNARGFARYLQGLLGRGDYLGAANRALLLSPARGRSGRELGRSLGWPIGRLEGQAYFAHAGGAAGYYCEIRIYAQIGRASVVMFNRSGIRDEHFLDGIDRFFIAGDGR